MNILNPEEILRPASDKLLPPFPTSSVSECLSPGSDAFTAPLKDLTAFVKEALPRPETFPLDDCLSPSGHVLLPPADQPGVDKALYPKAEDLLPLVEKLLPPSEDLMPRPDLKKEDSSK